jgi:hypothetical protein
MPDKEGCRIAKIWRCPVNKRMRLIRLKGHRNNRFEEEGKMFCKPNHRLKAGRLVWVQKRDGGDPDHWQFVGEYKERIFWVE